MITYGITLSTSTTETGAYTKLVDIKDIPDLFPSPDMVENTTLSNGSRTFEMGIKNTQPLPFTVNFSETAFTDLKSKEGTTLFFKLQLGTGGLSFGWSGKLSVTINGAGVNDVMEMTITTSIETEMKVLA